MSKKDYKLITKVLKKSFDHSIEPSLNSFVFDLMYELKRDNPRFSRKEFTEAVYGEEA